VRAASHFTGTCANLSGPERVKKVAISKSATPMSIETPAMLITQMNSSFAASNKSITVPKRMRSNAFPMGPRHDEGEANRAQGVIARQTTTPARINATATFSAVGPQRVSSADTGTRPSALLQWNRRLRSRLGLISLPSRQSFRVTTVSTIARRAAQWQRRDHSAL